MTQVHIKTQAPQHGYGTLNGFTEIVVPDSVRGDDAKTLYIINNMLVEQRLKAWDHERGGEMFHGAALIRTKEDRYYLAANIHLQNPKTTRNCAEANAATCAVNAEGIDMQIADLWFMGGKGDISKKIEIVPGDVGRRNSPCGSCLDVIWNNQLQRIEGALSGETHIHMLPLNTGNISLMPDDGRPIRELEPNQVMSRRISQLLPHVSYAIPDADGSLKTSIQAGYQLLKEPLTGKAIGAAMTSQALAELNDMQNPSGDEAVKRINDLMIDTLHRLSERSAVPLKSARVAVVRLDNGEFYLGVSLDNGYTTAMQPAESDAIQAALKTHPTMHSITDMFVMAVDFEKMPQQLDQMQAAPSADVVVKMPDGAARDRLSKAGPRAGLDDVFGSMVDKNTGANVHVMTLNDKTHFDAKKHMISMSVRDLLPYRFISPKMDVQHLKGVH